MIALGGLRTWTVHRQAAEPPYRLGNAPLRFAWAKQSNVSVL